MVSSIDAQTFYLQSVLGKRNCNSYFLYQSLSSLVTFLHVAIFLIYIGQQLATRIYISLCSQPRIKRIWGWSVCLYLISPTGDKRYQIFVRKCTQERTSGRILSSPQLFLLLEQLWFYAKRSCEFTSFHEFLVVRRKSLMFSPPDFSLQRLKHKHLRNRLRHYIWPKLRSLGTKSSCGSLVWRTARRPNGRGGQQGSEG